MMPRSVFGGGGGKELENDCGSLHRMLDEVVEERLSVLAEAAGDQNERCVGNGAASRFSGLEVSLGVRIAGLIVERRTASQYAS